MAARQTRPMIRIASSAGLHRALSRAGHGYAERVDAVELLQAIRTRAMAAEPEGRYAGVRELSADLGRYLDGLPVAAYRESLLEQAGRVFRRYRAPILIVLAYLLMRALLILILGR